MDEEGQDRLAPLASRESCYPQARVGLRRHKPARHWSGFCFVCRRRQTEYSLKLAQKRLTIRHFYDEMIWRSHAKRSRKCISVLPDIPWRLFFADGALSIGTADVRFAEHAICAANIGEFNGGDFSTFVRTLRLSACADARGV